MVTRVLVSGSRTWRDKEAVWRKLDEVFAGCTERSPTGARMVLVHGMCGEGADNWADLWGRTQPDVIVERHPAEWKKFGRKVAGMIRNKEMIDSGIDVALFFIHDDSPGATGCLKLAKPRWPIKPRVPVIKTMRKYGPWDE